MKKMIYIKLQELVQGILIMLFFVMQLIILSCVNTGYQIPTPICIIGLITTGWFTAKVIYTMERGSINE